MQLSFIGVLFYTCGTDTRPSFYYSIQRRMTGVAGDGLSVQGRKSAGLDGQSNVRSGSKAAIRQMPLPSQPYIFPQLSGARDRHIYFSVKGSYAV